MPTDEAESLLARNEVSHGTARPWPGPRVENNVLETLSGV